MRNGYWFFKGCEDEDVIPQAWLHVLHMDLDQKEYQLSFSPENPFGEPDEDYSPDYVWESWKLNLGDKSK